MHAFPSKYFQKPTHLTHTLPSHGAAKTKQEAESWFTRLGDLAPVLVRFGEAFDEMQSYQDAVVRMRVCV